MVLPTAIELPVEATLLVGFITASVLLALLPMASASKLLLFADTVEAFTAPLMVVFATPEGMAVAVMAALTACVLLMFANALLLGLVILLALSVMPLVAVFPSATAENALPVFKIWLLITLAVLTLKADDLFAELSAVAPMSDSTD